MPILNTWIDRELAKIANVLPGLVETQPTRFACGYMTGQKHALLNLEKLLDSLVENNEIPKSFTDLYKTSAQIMDDMQW